MKKEVFDKKVKSARKLQATQKPIRTVSKSKLIVKVLYRNKRYWLAVSAEGHRWIHDHPDEARAHGWLCAK